MSMFSSQTKNDDFLVILSIIILAGVSGDAVKDARMFTRGKCLFRRCP